MTASHQDRFYRYYMVAGLLLVLIGTIILSLALSTKVFYTNTKIPIAAGSSAFEGYQLLSEADVGWDDSGIVLNSDGTFKAWQSITWYTDDQSANKPYYPYTLVKSVTNDTLYVNKSNSNANGISFIGATALLNDRSSNHAWSLFPKYQADNTIIFACTCPTSSDTFNGMGVSHMSVSEAANTGHKYDSYINVDTESVNRISQSTNTVISSVPIVDIKTYVPFSPIPQSNAVAKTDYVSAFSYNSTTHTYRTYFNGNQALIQNPPTLEPLVAAEQPLFTVGFPVDSTGAFHGTVYAVYVFSRVLTQLQIDAISTYLRQKYFAPAVDYPASSNLPLNENISIRPTPVDQTAPIIKYTISPDLPKGLTMNEKTGEISGSLAVPLTGTLYTISAANASMNTTVDITLQTIVQASIPSPPSISFDVNLISVGLGVAFTTPEPVNSGGDTEFFSISPVPVDSGITFYSTTGVMSGTPTLNQDVTYAITAENAGGSSISYLRLLTGILLSYPTGQINGRINSSIQPVTPSLISAADQFTLTSYTSTGDLLGLTLDPNTGVISGAPTKAMVSDVTITAHSDPDLKTIVRLNVVDDKTFKYKNAYVGVSSAALAIGVILLVGANAAKHVTKRKTK